MVDWKVVKIALIILYTIGLLMHTFGLFLLRKARKSSMDKTQRLIIINTSICELITCIHFVSYTSLEMIDRNIYLFLIKFSHGFEDFCQFLFFLIMLLLIFDRLLRITLGIHYPAYWSIRYTHISLVLIWLSSIVITLILHLCNVPMTTINIIFTCLGVIFVFISFVTYGYGFYKLCEIKKKHSLRLNMTVARQRRRLFKGFIMILLLISTFIFFILIPFLIYTYFFFEEIESQVQIQIFVTIVILRSFGYICDPLIYIFLSPEIRKIILRRYSRRSSGANQSSLSKLMRNTTAETKF